MTLTSKSNPPTAETMQESEFHRLADRTLLAMQDALESADEEGALDADYAGGVLTIQIEGGQVYVVSKHAPSRQLWLSSPVSGGLHFSYDTRSGGWLLTDGRHLANLLASELQTLAGVSVSF